MFNNEINHLIEKGDNLYSLASRYNTTVEDILLHNPGMDPYHLLIGSYVKIPVRNSKMSRETPKEKMRIIWEQHVFWTRLVIISIIDRLNDEKESTERLLRNANDIANLYEPYYGKEVANKIRDLIKDHLVIAANLVHAARDNNKEEVKITSSMWYTNADETAHALSQINKLYDEEVLRDMLYTHLNLTKEEALDRISGNHQKEINTFDNIEKQAIEMADYLSYGLEQTK